MPPLCPNRDRWFAAGHDGRRPEPAMSYKSEKKGLIVAAVCALAVSTVFSLGSIVYQYGKARPPERPASGSAGGKHPVNKSVETTGVVRRPLVD